MNRKTILFWLRAISLVGIYGGLLMPLVFIPVVIFPFVFSKLIFLQILIGITFPVYCVLAWMEPSARPPKHVLIGAIVFYLAAIGFSSIFGVDPARSWWGNQERMNGLFSLLHFLAWLLMATGLIKTWAQWRRLLNFELALSVIMAFVSILQIPFPKLLLFPVGDRIGGLLDNPIYMAAYQIFNIFFALWLLVKAPAKSTKGIYACIIVVQFIAFFLAQSRGALVGVAAGLITMAIIIGATQRDKRIKRGVLGAIAIAFVAYGILFGLRNTSFVQHSPFERITTGFTVIPEPRLIAWRIAWEGFKERPLFGWGFDDFHILFNLKYNPQSLRYSQYETWFDRSHNTVMDVLAMTGLLGLIGFVAVYLALFWSLYRSYREGRLDSISLAVLGGLPVAYFVQNIFVFDHPAAFTMSYLLFALVVGVSSHHFHVPGAEPKDSPAPALGKSHDFPAITFCLVELIALAIVWRFSVLPFQASRTMIQANSAMSMRPARYDLALELFRQARAIPTPYTDEQAYLAAKDLTDQAQDPSLRTSPVRDALLSLSNEVMQEELVKHPLSTNMLFLAARYYQELAIFNPTYTQMAANLYQKALTTSPKRQQLFFALADFSYRQNQIDQGLAYEKQAMQADPELGQGHLAYGISLLYRKHDQANGAKEILLSQSVAFPYGLTLTELPTVVDAAFIAKDQAALKYLIEHYSGLGISDQYVSFYASLAQRLSAQGYPNLRDDLYRNLPIEILNQVKQRAALTQPQPTIEAVDVETVSVTSTKAR